MASILLVEDARDCQILIQQTLGKIAEVRIAPNLQEARRALSAERFDLIAAVWGASVHVLDRTVDTHIYTLRKKLGSHATYVDSEVGLGYRFNSSAQPAKKGKTAA